MSEITQRKRDHIHTTLNDPLVERRIQSDFDSLQLTHRALPQLDFADVDSTSQFLGKTISFPFLISSMTGGLPQEMQDINRHLAEAAEICQVPMAVGSQRSMILDETAQASFKLRQFAPSTPLIANFGAVQLNYGFGIEEAQKVVEILQADALYLHLNPLQELIQPEGNHNFANLAEKIHNLSEKLEVPIILKEVGSGLSPADIELGLEAGIAYFDIAGRGGTSWSRIEAHRAKNNMGILFQDWGITTLQALALAKPYQKDAYFIASGGIRNGIDMVKAVIMGGHLCGVAAPLLAPACESTDNVVKIIEQFKQEFATAQFLLGAEDVNSLHLNNSLLLP